MNHYDDRGVRIDVGDQVTVTHINRSRGAEMWMGEGTVIGFGRNRAHVKFPSRVKPCSVGPECLRILTVRLYNLNNPNPYTQMDT